MTIHLAGASAYLRELLTTRTQDDLRDSLASDTTTPTAPFPLFTQATRDTVAALWSRLAAGPQARAALADATSVAQADRYGAQVENFLGTVKVPVGLAGPLRVHGLFAQGDFPIPLATTEAALVASYHRGARLITEVGGCRAVLLNEGISRAPAFVFHDVAEAGAFVIWALQEKDAFRRRAEETTAHGRLRDVYLAVEGNHVYLQFQFDTGNASGQNMVTIATAAICDHIRAHSPVTPRRMFIEANFSGDKKACQQSFLAVRGRKATAEVVLPAARIEEWLGTSVDEMADYWRLSAVGGSLSGAIGIQGHVSNALAALYIACGQDAACVAESCVGITRMERTPQGDLYASVTLPNIVVGTVGGGTGLPAQAACLEILGFQGPDGARAFAEVCAGVALAGELSIVGAICARDFTRAHQVLGRQRHRGRPATPDRARSPAHGGTRP